MFQPPPAAVPALVFPSAIAPNDIYLAVYDLSKGLAKQFSQTFIGMQVDGIWHTGIVVYGKEYFFGGYDGISHISPGTFANGTLVQFLRLGSTEVTEDLFLEYLSGMKQRFCAHNYNLFHFNCNTFTDEASIFLLGKQIPSYIRDLPQEVLKSPMLQNLLQGFSGFSPLSPNPPSAAQSFIPSASSLVSPPSTTPVTTFNPTVPVLDAVLKATTRHSHQHLTLQLIDQLNSTLLFTAVPAVDKILPRLQTFISASSSSPLPTSLQNEAEQSLLICEEWLKQKADSLFSLPIGFPLLWVRITKEKAESEKYPFLDILRLLALNKHASTILAQGDEVIGLMRSIVSATTILSNEKASIWNYTLVLKLACNLSAGENGTQFLIKNLKYFADILPPLFSVDDPSVKSAAASLLFNLSLVIPLQTEISDEMVAFLSSLVHHLNTKSLVEETAFIMLATVGKLCYMRTQSVELVNVLGLDVDFYIKSSTKKVHQVASDISLLMNFEKNGQHMVSNNEPDNDQDLYD